jgi:hypothetical protein
MRVDEHAAAIAVTKLEQSREEAARDADGSSATCNRSAYR